MSLPRSTLVNGACQPPSMKQGEASPTSSPACSTPRELEESLEDRGPLVADFELLRDFLVAQGNDGTDVPDTSARKHTDDKQPETFARIKISNGSFGFRSDEDDNDDDGDEYRPKGAPQRPTQTQTSSIRTAGAVGKPATK